VEGSERSAYDAMVVAPHGLVTSAVAEMTVCMVDVDVAVVAKVAQPNLRAYRIRPSSHLFYDYIRN